MKFLILLLAIAQIGAVAKADAPTSPTGSSLHAYRLAREKRWKEANDEARKATQTQPKDAETWFMLGMTEERLENLSAAATAYEKYLALSPQQTAAEPVRAKLPDLKSRAKRKNEDVYGTQSSGFYFGALPSYNPAFVDQVNGSLGTGFDLGFNFSFIFLGYRRASGSFKEDIKTPSLSTPITYTTVTGGGKIYHQELYMNAMVSLIDPYTKMGNVQLGLPIYFGGFMNTLEVGGKKYGNMGFDMGTGLALRGFTRSTFTWYVQGLYHLGLPFWGIRQSSEREPIRNARDEDILGGSNTFELGAGIGFLFGSKVKKHY